MTRVWRRLARLGIVAATTAEGDVDPLADESEALAGLSRAAVLGRTALGRRTGRGPLRLGADPDAPWIERHVPLHAHEQGFDLHAAVRVPAGDRRRLADLCRYLCRPPLGQHRIERLLDGRIAVALQRPWADGTTHLVFTPLELLQRLVPLGPRPRINLLLYHGVLAPNAPWRRAVVAREPAAPVAAPAATDPSTIDAPPPGGGRRTRTRPRYRSWAELMRRAFDADVLACPTCGGRMVLLATIEDPAVIRRILTHLGVSLDEGHPLSRRAPPWPAGPFT